MEGRKGMRGKEYEEGMGRMEWEERNGRKGIGVKNGWKGCEEGIRGLGERDKRKER